MWALLLGCLSLAASPVLVVSTPGVKRAAYQPLLSALEHQGLSPVLLRFPCAEQRTDELVRTIQTAANTLPQGTPIVAHGVGATLSLLARPEGSALILLAPVLAVWPTQLSQQLATRPLGLAIRLNTKSEAAKLLMGAPGLPLGCVSGAFAQEVLSWQTRPPTLGLTHLRSPVWMGFSVADQLATLEANIALSATPPRSTVVRFGLNRLDPQDFSHSALLMHPIPVRAAARAARSLR